jgi:hypothetical protein
MNKERYLTVRWNNRLTLALGLPTLAYAIVGLSTSALTGLWGFIGMAILGAVY